MGGWKRGVDHNEVVSKEPQGRWYRVVSSSMTKWVSDIRLLHEVFGIVHVEHVSE